MTEQKKLLTIIDPKITEEMRKHLAQDLIVENVVTSDSQMIIAPFALAKEHKKPFYVTDRPANFREIFKAQGLGYLPKGIFSTSFGEKFAKIITGTESIASLSDLFAAEAEVFKVSQYFQVGSLVDRFTETASESLNNYLSFHRSLYHIFQFLCYFANKEGFSPIECEKVKVADGIALQLSIQLDSEDIPLFKSILLKDENDSKQFLTRDFVLALEDCDFTDLTFVQKTNRLFVTVFYSAKTKERWSGFRFSDNLSLQPRETNEQNVTHPAKAKEVRVLNNQFPEVKIEADAEDSTAFRVAGSNEKITEEIQRVSGTKEDLGEEAIRVKGAGALKDDFKQVVSFNSESAKENFPPAKKFALFIRNFREREGLEKDNHLLTDDEIIGYLYHYPRIDVTKNLSEEVKKLICIMVREDDVYQNVSNALAEIGESTFLNKVEEVQKVISNKNIDDVAEIITVKGGKDYKEEVIKVKGWLEEGKDELIKIKSNYEELSNEEKWEVKKLHVNEVLSTEIEKIKSSGQNVTQKDYSRILSENLGISDEDSHLLVQGIVENAAADLVVQRIEKLRKNFEEPDVLKVKNLNNATADSNNGEYQKTVVINNTKLEEQIVKMKKVMDGMKSEIIRLRTSSVQKAPTFETTNPDFQMQLVQVELDKTKMNLTNKEKIFAKFKEDMELVLKDKDKQINSLKERVEQVKAENAESSEADLQRKNDQLNLENRTMKTKLELALKKIQIMSENMDKQDAEFMQKKEREVEQLKNQVSLSQTVMQKFKEEKQKYEAEIFQLKEKVSRSDSESKNRDKAVDDQEIMKRDTIIQSLTQEKKSAEDQYKLQGIELKKLEQKIKILVVQNEELTKKKGGNTKNVENAQRQVELANQKTQEAVTELTEKKKDILKLKNENSILSVKIQELERKLASLERAKAS